MSEQLLQACFSFNGTNGEDMMTVRWARTARLKCGVVLCMTLPPVWLSFGESIANARAATAVCRTPTVDQHAIIADNVSATNRETPLVALIDKKWASITTLPHAAACALLAEVSVLGFTYCLLKRRKAELLAFCSWLASAIERRVGTTEAGRER
jgi:hypothetical protein